MDAGWSSRGVTQEVSGPPRRLDAPAAEHPVPAVVARLESDDWAALAGALAQLAGLPVAGTDPQRLLGEVAVLLRRAVPAAAWASVTVGSPLEPTGLGSDSTQAQAFDGRQLQAQEGPSFDAFRTGAAVSTPDVTTDHRWPALARLAGRSPIRGVLAVPLGAADLTGVLGLYSAEPHGFGPANRRAAELLTAAVSGVLHNVAECESLRALAANLRCALSSRAVIDQAKGVLMARFGVDAEGAFALLVAVSKRL
ncbi:MAG TPA: GAF and ANTAR domain-containing protein, partial [Actinomycetes bacterium]|nr:GAF and ANTAR domain-containing protein [Actinomycetes bacterium]